MAAEYEARHRTGPGRSRTTRCASAAHLDLAELAPFAEAFGIELPRDGLLQLFAREGGAELAAGDFTHLRCEGEST